MKLPSRKKNGFKIKIVVLYLIRGTNGNGGNPSLHNIIGKIENLLPPYGTQDGTSTMIRTRKTNGKMSGKLLSGL